MQCKYRRTKQTHWLPRAKSNPVPGSCLPPGPPGTSPFRSRYAKQSKISLLPRPLTLERTAHRLAHAFAVATLLVLLAAIYFAQPTGDDFGKAANGHLGILHTLRGSYFELGGRWNTNLLQAFLFSRVPLLHLYPLLLLANLALLGFALYRLLAALGSPTLSPRQMIRASLTFLLILWTSSEHVGDTFFWATGGVEYLGNAGFALLLIAALLAPSPSIPSRAGAVLLALYLGGSHELILIVLILVLAGGAWSFRERSDPRARRWLGFAVLLTILLCLLITSPGAVHRASAHDGSFQPVRALVFTAVRLLTDLPGVLLQAPVLFATLWIAADRRVSLALFGSSQPSSRDSLRGAAILVLLIGLTLFLPALALGGYCPPRAITLATLELLLGWFLLVARVSARWDIPASVASPLRAYLPVALSAALFLSPTCQTTARTVAFAVPAWSRAVHQRYLDLQRQAAAGVHRAEALAVPATPAIYFDYVLAPDPQARPNYFAARYFRMETITLKRPAQ